MVTNYPLLGPFGTTKGKTPPTPPQKTVKMINGSAAAPMISKDLIYLELFGRNE